jgi:hypothetical protein
MTGLLFFGGDKGVLEELPYLQKQKGASFEDNAVDDYCNAHENEAPEQGRSTEGHLGRSKCAGLQSQCGSRTTNGQAMNRYAAQEIE